jgi:hypothetical protein
VQGDTPSGASRDAGEPRGILVHQEEEDLQRPAVGVGRSFLAQPFQMLARVPGTPGADLAAVGDLENADQGVRRCDASVDETDRQPRQAAQHRLLVLHPGERVDGIRSSGDRLVHDPQRLAHMGPGVVVATFRVRDESRQVGEIPPGVPASMSSQRFVPVQDLVCGGDPPSLDEPVAEETERGQPDPSQRDRVRLVKSGKDLLLR